MKYVLLAICLTLTFTSVAQPTLVVRNVNVVDVENGRAVPERTVVIRDSLIQRVATASQVPIPEGATVIDGIGQYLMPGLIDAHVHFFQTGGLYTRPDVIDLRDAVPYAQEMARAKQLVPDHFRRYLRLGITTVMDVGGPFYNFTIRDSVAGQTLAPHVLVTGPLFSTYQPEALTTDDSPIIRVTTVAAADSLFQRMLPYRPDLIKVWYIVTPEFPAEATFPIIQRIGQLARQANLPLAVHATELRTAQLAVEAGASILVHSVKDSLVSESFVNLLKERAVTYVPTLLVSNNYGKVRLANLDHHAQDLRWGNSQVYGSLSDLEGYSASELPASIVKLREQPEAYRAYLSRSDSVMAANLRTLTEAGVNVAVGTDAGNIGTLHASSYRQELEAMQKAGLSPAEILRSATLSAATGLGRQDQLGTVTEGKLADLLLLTHNPLEQLPHPDSLIHIIKAGQLLAVDTLVVESPEMVVQRQLNAYNARDMDAFLDTYADSIAIYDFPHQLAMRGKSEMRTRYAPLFEEVSNLYGKVKQRIVIGNTVIDQEHVRAGERYVDAVAIYEVAGGKIARVTFVRE